MAPVCTHRIINQVLVNELILKGQVELGNVLDTEDSVYARQLTVISMLL